MLPYFLHVLMFMARLNVSKRRIVKVFLKFPSILWNKHLFIELVNTIFDSRDKKKKSANDAWICSSH